MDAALLISSLALTSNLSPVCLPNHNLVFSLRKRNLLSLRVVAALVLALISLSIVECLPSRLLLFLTNESENDHHASGKISTTTGYTVILTALCVCLLVVFPTVIGLHLVLQKPDPSNNASDRRPQVSPRSTVVRLSTSIGILIVRVLFALFRFVWKLFSGLVHVRDRTAGLPLVHQHAQTRKQRKMCHVLGKLLLSATFVLSFWTALRALTPLVIDIPQHQVPFLTHAVSWLCAVGLLLSATLNGFGSVSFPFTSLVPIYLKPVTAEAVAAAEMELGHLQNTLDMRLRQMNEPELRIQSMPLVTSGRAGRSTSGSWQVRNNSFSDLGGEVTQRKCILLNEILFLESLMEDSRSDVDEMRRSYKLSMQARTPFGRAKSWLGVIMSIVLLLRLATALLNLSSYNQSARNFKEDSMALADRENTSGHSTRTDMVTLFLLWMSGHTSLVKSEHQLNQLTHFLSLLLTAFLTISQVQMFLRTASSVGRRLLSVYSSCHSCQKKESHRSEQVLSSVGLPRELLLSTVYSYLLAFLAGCYFVACIVLTKLLLPDSYSRCFARALGGTDRATHPGGGGGGVFWIRPYAVNAAFCTSSLLATFGLGLLFAIQRQNTHRYVSWTPAAAAASSSSSLLPGSFSKSSSLERLSHMEP